MQTEYKSIVPEKSPNDKREYEALTLKNGAKILLIHDPVLEKSACSISVGVGSLENPDKSLGLAHFLEHMLFMGSTKYPSTNEYSSFISLNSGMDNAFTSDQETNYYFEVANKVFPEAMERLCDFFTGALLTKSCVQKERQAVHEEYVLWTNDDNCRKWQVLRKLALPPFYNFSIGNNTTLADENVRQQLVEFYNKHYSANLTNAVLCSSMSINDMKNTLAQHLEMIPNKNHPGFKYDIPYPKDKLGKMVRMESIKDQTILEFFFLVDHLRYKYKEHIGDYLTHILGHEGKNSLLQILKRREYASTLTSYQHDLMCQTVIGLDIKLTEVGQQNYQQVYNIVMDYTASLKAQRSIYEQLRERARIDFQFKQKSQTYRYVCGLSSKMHYIPLQEILNHKALFTDFQEDAINKALGLLNPFNTIIVFSHSDTIQDSTTEQFLGAKYKICALPQRKKTQEKFQPLLKNIFVPVSTEVYNPDSNASKTPTKIRENVYFLQDGEFKVCKGGVRLIVNGPEKNPFIQLYVVYLELLLKTITYDAEVLSTKIHFEQHDKLVIHFFGLNDTVRKLVEKIGKDLKKCHETPESEIFFNISKEECLEHLQNFYRQQVNHVAEETRKIIMKQGRVEIRKTIEEITKYEYKDYTQRALSFWQQATIEWVIVGNFLEKEANEMVQNFEASIGRKETAPINSVGCVKIPDGKQLKHQILIDEEQIKTSCCVTLFQAGQYSEKLFYSLELLKNHIAEPFFNELRTQKQLAYYLSSRVVNIRGVLGLHFMLVSSTIDAEKINQEIKRFVTGFFGKLKEDLTGEKFSKIKESVRVKYVAPHNNLSKMCEFIATQVNNRTFYFNRKDKEEVSKQLDAISVDDLVEVANGLLKRSLNVLVTSRAHLEEYKTHKPETQDVQSIHKEVTFYEDNISKTNFSFKK